MGRRHVALPAARPRDERAATELEPAPPSAEGPGPAPSPALAELLARLQVATQLRDAPAATRILDRLADSEDGQWLLRQCVAAGLRDLAGQLTDPDVRRIGAA